MSTLQEHYNTCLFHAASALGRSLTKLADEHFKPIEITPTMGFILMTAKAAPGIMIVDLANVHQLDASTVSRALDKLAAHQLIVREGVVKCIRVFITPKGGIKEAEARSAWIKLQQAYSLILSEPGAKHLADQVADADGRLRAAVPKRRPRPVKSPKNA